MRALGEPLFEEGSYCEKHASPETGAACVHTSGCALRALWQTLEQWMRGTLNQITLADLMTHEGRIIELLRARLATTVFDDAQPLISLGILNK